MEKFVRRDVQRRQDIQRQVQLVAAAVERQRPHQSGQAIGKTGFTHHGRIAALAEGSVAKREVSDIAQRVDEVAEGMRRTDETMRQLQLPPELEDLEEPPPLLRDEA